MTVLPIVERELRVAARRRGTHWLRVLVTLAGMLVFTVGLWMLERRRVPAAEHGRLLFRGLLVLGFLHCALAGVRATADAVSEEKREGTLGLLFLTDLRGYDVVLGKLVAGSLGSFYGLLALFPIIFLPLQLGGVTGTQLIHTAVVLLNALFFSVAAGMLVSILSRDERKAMYASLFLILTVILGPAFLLFLLEISGAGPFNSFTFLAAVLAFSPAFGLAYVLFESTPFLRLSPWMFWASAAWTQILSWILLVGSCLALPRLWHVDPDRSRLARWRERWEQWLYGVGPARQQHRNRLLQAHPFLWLAQRERGKPAYVWLFLGAVTVMWTWGRLIEGDVMIDAPVAWPTVWLVQTFFRLWVVSEACSRLCEDRRSGALELLLSTPLSDREVIRGQWLALRRQFGRPLLVMLVLQFLLLRESQPAGTVLAGVVMQLADFVTLGWVGMWLGLTARSLTRAILGTVLPVLVLPWFAAYVTAELAVVPSVTAAPISMSFIDGRTLIWFIIGLANNVGWGWFWARRRLQTQFRQAAVHSHVGLPRSRGRRTSPLSWSGAAPPAAT